MQLVVERAGVEKTVSLELERASTILKKNQWKVVGGNMVPLWLPNIYAHCF
jgi:hypothetical protein